MQSMAMSAGGPSPAGHPSSLRSTILTTALASGAASGALASLACMALAPRQFINISFGSSPSSVPAADSATAGDTAPATGDTSRGDAAPAAGADAAPATGSASSSILPSSSHLAKQIAGDLCSAAIWDNATEVRAILEEYPEAAVWQSWSGNTALYHSASSGDSMPVLKLLLAAAPQAAAIPCGKQRSTPAHAGKGRGCREVVAEEGRDEG